MKAGDRFRFGTYKGRLLWHVIRDGPACVAWLLENLGGFQLAPDALEHLRAVRDFLTTSLLSTPNHRLRLVTSSETRTFSIGTMRTVSVGIGCIPTTRLTDYY